MPAGQAPCAGERLVYPGQAGRSSSLGIGPVYVPGAAVTSPAYVTVGEIRSSSVSGAQWGTVDVSNFQSGVDEEFITTMRNNGEVSLAGNRVSSDAGQVACEAAFSTGELYMFQITVTKAAGQTAGDLYTFNALVVSREFAIDVTKEISWNVKLKISGPLTLVPGA